MKTLLKAVFTFAGFVGLFVLMCAFSTVDHAGTIPISDGQILMTAIMGVTIIAVAVLGFNSVDQKGDKK